MNNSQKLGIKVFYYYLSKRISVGLLMLVLSLVVTSVKDAIASKVILLFSISTTVLIVDYLTIGLFVISILLIASSFFMSWINYVSLSFSLGENAISIQKGILNKKEVSIPYRQIQNINIEQTFNYRMMGVSKLVILTAGNDDNDRIGKSEGVFEVIDSKIAQKIREDVLQRSNPQVLNETKTV